MPVDAEVIVIGAGVVGLAVARALAIAGREVVVVDAERRFGMHASSRNSEVIHAGIYYPPGSLKSRLCISGRSKLYDYCERAGVCVRRLGKLIVATTPGERPTLDRIASNAARSGVGLDMLNQEAVYAKEPGVQAVAALWSPSTGIVDSHGLMQSLSNDAEASGAAYVWSTRVRALTQHGQDLEVATDDDRILCRWVVNAAGHGARAILEATQGLAPRSIAPRYLVKGNYFSLRGRHPFRHLIYPVPASASLGIHLTLDLQGRARFGPDQEAVDELDYTVNPERADRFARSIRAYWPDLPDDALEPDYAGVRVRVAAEGPADFRIDGPSAHGIPGLVNLQGIESPGLTACLAIADEVLARLDDQHGSR